MSYEVLESKLTYEGKIVKVTVDKLQMAKRLTVKQLSVAKTRRQRWQ